MSPGSALSAKMSNLARTDTAPELALRRELHRRGLRYRVQFHVPGNRRRRMDVAFTRAKVAVFVDGCYWHGCPEHGTRPRTNREWWDWKIQRNRDRDADTNRLLDEQGWTVVRVWEHEDPATAANRIEQLVRPTV
ncbi:very short patch repair endonuclease [Aeromicrobium sp. Leaf291]|uniref:very short patch repair endonuclease n=1 Tax=Aeromicrobium sp. Leaf291 TaxID=1736325 RepID=UPI00210172FA|nr:very short patch repair endonuclease [Aeromicrobium sp. Leaf291]